MNSSVRSFEWGRLRSASHEGPQGVAGALEVAVAEGFECAGDALESLAVSLRGRGTALRAAFAARDAEAAEDRLRALAGFGPGLTPAGDDYLVGCFHALWALEPARWLARPGAVAAARTTTLSAKWLRAAARGRVSDVWHGLLTVAVEGGDPERLERRAKRVVAQGHTSGLAAALGFLDMLEGAA